MISACKFWLVGIVTLAASALSVRSEEALNSNQAAIRGVVTDSAGKPVPGATLKFNQYEGGHLDPMFPSATTDEKGEYALQFGVTEPVIVKQLWISHPGFVRIDYMERFRDEPGKDVPLDFQLQPGEIISGTVEPPGSVRQIPYRTFMLRVTGDKFEQIHVTDSEGRFQFYVPEGEYRIKVLDFPDVSFGPQKIRTGTRDVVLKPQRVVVSEKVLATAFDRMWEAIDHSYSYFAYKPDVDWNALREAYRPRAVACTSVSEFVGVLKEMLAELRDLHVWIETEEGLVGTYSTPWQRNWNPRR